MTAKKKGRFSGTFLNHAAFWFVAKFATPLFIAINNSDDIVLGLGSHLSAGC